MNKYGAPGSSSAMAVLFTVFRRFILGAAYMRKIIPHRWDVSPEWDLGRMVYFTLWKQCIYMRIDLSHLGEISLQRKWDIT